MILRGILAFDIDGTLTQRNQSKITPESLVGVLDHLDKMGYYSVPVTGKPAEYAIRLFAANNLDDRGIIAENSGVYRRPGDQTIEVFGSSLEEMKSLRFLLGIKDGMGNVLQITLHDKQYDVAVDPEDISILTIFSDPEPVSHRWQFRKSIDALELHDQIQKIISEKDWVNYLEVLPPFPDGAIQVVRKNQITGETVNKSKILEVIGRMYEVSSPLPVAMFGDGHNDIPAMKPNGVIPITFANGDPDVKDVVTNKNGFVAPHPAVEGPGVVEGIFWLADDTSFFGQDSATVKNLTAG